MTTYLVAIALVVGSIQLYLLWRLLRAFEVLRRFEDRLGHYGDALSLLTETTETGFDSLGRELERLRALGEVRAELRGAAAPAAPKAAVTVAPRHAVAEAVAEALMARAESTPAHELAAPPMARREASPAVPAVAPARAASGPTVAFVQVAGGPAAVSVPAVERTASSGPSVTFVNTRAEAPRAAAANMVTSSTVAAAEPDEALDLAGSAELSAASDPVGEVVRLIESAQGRPSPAQLNEAAVRLRMHLAGGTARARQTNRPPLTARLREERPHGALRS